MHCQVGSLLNSGGTELPFFLAKELETKKEKRQLRTSNNILAVNEKPTILKTVKKRKH
jgi:hypothetical protein